MTAIPVPNDIAAVSSGSAVASSEPNTRNSTIAADRNPNVRPLPSFRCLPAWATCPSTSYSMLAFEPDVTFETNVCAAWLLILLGCRSNVTFANATCPDGAIWCAPVGPYGDWTLETWGWRAISARCACTAARVAGSVTPFLAAITTWSVSPEAFGAFRCSSRTASKLWVRGSWKLSL